MGEKLSIARSPLGLMQVLIHTDRSTIRMQITDFVWVMDAPSARALGAALIECAKTVEENREVGATPPAETVSV
jgi:hypothetical protein